MSMCDGKVVWSQCDHTTLKMALVASAFAALPINTSPHPVAPISTFLAPYNLQVPGVKGPLSLNRVLNRD